jgi:glycosyltransferase involved in cell wall biosynthesis
MNIALFLNRGIKPDSGGTYSFEKDLLVSLSQFKYECNHTFYVFGWDASRPKEILDFPHIKYVQCFSFFRTAKFIYKQLPEFLKTKKIKNTGKEIAGFALDEREIFKILIKHKIDITWSLGLNSPTLKIPNIVTVWDLQHRLQPYFPELGEWENHENFYLEVLGRSSYIITGTNAGKTEVQQFYQVPSERVKVIPFATPFFALKASWKDKNKLFEKHKIPDFFFDDYLFYPAQFWPHKNHVNLLLAIKYLRDKFNLCFPLMLAGSNKGNLTYIKKIVVDLDLSEQVHFVGFVSQADLVSFYHHAFALTFVSLFGPDNLPPLEAFALECPVIASNVPGAEEQLGNAALIVDTKNPVEIALAIKSLKEEPDLRQTLVDRGLERAAQWTGQDYIREVCSILDEFASIRRCWSNDEPYNLNLLNK